MNISPENTVTTLTFPADYEGAVTATVIYAPAKQKSSSAILYLHGYLDYFFQQHMAEYFTSRGKNFFALDLRKYGRSHMPHQHFNYCRNLDEYFEEIDRTLEIIAASGNTDITLMGHSTGGLLAVYYYTYRKSTTPINRIILNSPFLEFNTGRCKRNVAIPFLGAFSCIFPYISKKNELTDNYFISVHNSRKGEWDFNIEYKPEVAPPLYFAWLRAIKKAQRKIKRYANIDIPVLVMYSSLSTYHIEWHEEAMRSDTVLNVKDIRKYGAQLGSDVRLVEVKDGLHDLVLSPPEIRNNVLATMNNFIDK